MWQTPIISLPPRQQRILRKVAGIFLAAAFIFTIGTYMMLQSKISVMQNSYSESVTLPNHSLSTQPFPHSVNPTLKTITPNPEMEVYVQSYARGQLSRRDSREWYDRLISQLSRLNWYQTLATPHSRIIIISAGERNEQVADNISKILNWSEVDKEIFLQRIQSSVPAFTEGTLLPGRYVIPANSGPEYVTTIINDRFQRAVLNRYPEELETTLPLIDTLTIASLLQREAYDFSDMRIISGIIWNRLFIDMPLQIDATLQYARSTTEDDQPWWPVPRPVDKFIDSEHNTYQNKGLPPSPIANPSVASIIAALNPEPTDCLFYFHDAYGGFHCSQTYERHVELLRYYYGQGR